MINVVLCIVLAFIGVSVAIGAFILNEVIQELREIKYILEER
ncbi:hypothetical protein [Succinivibrio sp.]